MPRSRGGGSGARPNRMGSRPSSGPTQQTRPATTAAYPGQGQAAGQRAPAQQQQASSQGSGLLGQMASTAAGVAIGSSLGHAITGMFGGSSASSEPQQQQQVDPYANSQGMSSELYGNSQSSYAQQQAAQGPCALQVTGFKQCMDQNGSDLTICGWYMDQLKACQAAASRY